MTLLFSDIRGFTTLSETRRPEEVVALLNRYFSLQVDVVFRHGGSLDKFIGDCIMALWGAPLDDPEHARRAVACALDMADTLAVFKREFGEGAKDFDVGIGVHSGPADRRALGSRGGRADRVGEAPRVHRHRRHGEPREPHRGPHQGCQAPHPGVARHHGKVRGRLRFRIMRNLSSERAGAAGGALRAEA